MILPTVFLLEELIFHIDVEGRGLASGNMGAPVTSILFGSEGIVAGSAKGVVRY